MSDKSLAELKVIIEREVALQLEYAELLQKELSALTKFKTEEMTPLTIRRAELNEEMEALQHRRLEIVRGILPANSTDIPLIKSIEKFCRPDDIARLKPLALKLKELMQKNRAKMLEFGCVVDFSHNLVTSSISIIRSGSQTESETYGRAGTVQTSYIPKRPGGLGRRA